MAHPIHPYSSLVRRALATQRTLASRFTPRGWPKTLRYIGGADVAFTQGPHHLRAGAVGSWGLAIALIYDLQTQQPIEIRYARKRVSFPYVPGLLSFREIPILRAAIRRLQHPVDAWIFDAHGISHPRRIGLATHLGIQLHAPTVGAAKSILIGALDLAQTRRSGPNRLAPLLHHDAEIARALWSGPAKTPILISQGHMCSLDQATALVTVCTLPGNSMPEPTRLADALTKQARLLPPTQARPQLEALINYPQTQQTSRSPT